MDSPFLQESQDDWLTLTLSLPSSSPPPRPFPFQYIALLSSPPSSPPHLSPFQYTPIPLPPHRQPFFLAQEPNINKCRESKARARKARASTYHSNPNLPRAVRRKRDVIVKSETVPPPFPWATSKRAVVHTLAHLRSQGMTSITGAVVCKRCSLRCDIAFNLEDKFRELARFIDENKFDLHDRAPESWVNPVLPDCEQCGAENSLKPVIAKKRGINWLFLLLGQMIGCCNIGKLKYFCKHAMDIKSGAKDRLLYSVYLELCKQLLPN